MMAELSQVLPPDDTRGPQILAVSWITAALAVLAVALRINLRIKAQALGWDDCFICLALLSILLQAIGAIMQVHYGFGHHVAYIVPTISNITEWTIIGIIISYVSIFLVKISVSFFILRVIKGTHRLIRILLYYLMGFLAATTIAAIVAASVQCIPLKKLWEPNIPGTCFSSSVSQQVTRVFGGVSAATDLLCVIIPSFIIRGLQMDKRTKSALLVILALGLIPAACAIGKGVTTEFSSKDITWDEVPVEIWTILEANMGAFIASLPALQSPFSRLTRLATRLMSPKSSKFDQSRPKRSSFQNRPKSVRIDPSWENDADGLNLIPMNKVATKSTTDVALGQQASMSSGDVHPWEYA